MKFYDIAYTVYHIPYSGYDVKYFGDNGLGLSDVYVITQASQTRLRFIVTSSEGEQGKPCKGEVYQHGVKPRVP